MHFLSDNAETFPYRYSKPFSAERLSRKVKKHIKMEQRCVRQRHTRTSPYYAAVRGAKKLDKRRLKLMDAAYFGPLPKPTRSEHLRDIDTLWTARRMVAASMRTETAIGLTFLKGEVAKYQAKMVPQNRNDEAEFSLRPVRRALKVCRSSSKRRALLSLLKSPDGLPWPAKISYEST